MEPSNVYKLVEIVGTSSESVEDAIKKAIERASKTIQNLDWFEVIQTRGYIENNQLKSYQVILKVGFKLKE